MRVFSLWYLTVGKHFEYSVYRQTKSGRSNRRYQELIAATKIGKKACPGCRWFDWFATHGTRETFFVYSLSAKQVSYNLDDSGSKFRSHSA